MSNREFFVVAVQPCCKCDAGNSEGDVQCSHCKGLYRCQHRIKLEDALLEIQANRAGLVESPMAKNMNELVTPRQLVAVRAISNANRLDSEAECIACFNQEIKPEELSRKAASTFIDFLKAGGSVNSKQEAIPV